MEVRLPYPEEIDARPTESDAVWPRMPVWNLCKGEQLLSLSQIETMFLCCAADQAVTITAALSLVPVTVCLLYCNNFLEHNLSNV
jgi:hypothetical protein